MMKDLRVDLNIRRNTLFLAICFIATFSAQAADAGQGIFGRTLLQSSLLGPIGSDVKPKCHPQCKKGRWYTLGIPVVNCAHEEQTAWLTKQVCKEDVSISQLVPLVDRPDQCDLDDLRIWLNENCGFVKSASGKNLDRECRPRCKAPRWYTLGIPIPECTTAEYELWLNKKMCNTQDPISLENLVELVDNPDKCSLKELGAWLNELCAEPEVQSQSTGAPNGPQVTAQSGPNPQPNLPQRNLPMFGALNDEGYPELGLGNGGISVDKMRPPMPNAAGTQGRSTPQYNPSGQSNLPPTTSFQPSAVGGPGMSLLPPQCTLPYNAGSPACRSAIQAYYFDSNTATCKPFIYGGCGGNSNRFSSSIECEQTCKAKISAPQQLKLSLHSCGFAQSFSANAMGSQQKAPAVLNITGATPNTEVAVFRSPFTSRDDPISIASVPDNIKCANTRLGISGSFQAGPGQIKAWSIDVQNQGNAIFKISENDVNSPNYCSQYVYQAIDLTTCRISNILDTRQYMG